MTKTTAFSREPQRAESSGKAPLRSREESASSYRSVPSKSIFFFFNKHEKEDVFHVKKVKESSAGRATREETIQGRFGVQNAARAGNGLAEQSSPRAGPPGRTGEGGGCTDRGNAAP